MSITSKQVLFLNELETCALSVPEDGEPFLEQAYPHLRISNELFLRFTDSNGVDPEFAKRVVDQILMMELLEVPLAPAHGEIPVC